MKKRYFEVDDAAHKKNSSDTEACLKRKKKKERDEKLDSEHKLQSSEDTSLIGQQVHNLSNLEPGHIRSSKWKNKNFRRRGGDQRRQLREVCLPQPDYTIVISLKGRWFPYNLIYLLFLPKAWNL